jgi:hypothetical protein
MAIPIAVAAFCITASVCPEKRRRRIVGDQFVSQESCSFVREEPHPFTVGEIDMSQFIQSSISSLPSVTSVSIRTKHNRVQVEVTVDEFDWTNLAPIYQKELELSYTFREQPIDFRVIDASNAGKAARAL